MGFSQPGILDLTKAQMEANEYLKSKNIFDLFNFLVGHLLIEEPADPVEFLVHLLDKCIQFREGLGEPPLLFNGHHIESIFTAMDPGQVGTISMEQYKTAMKTIGVSDFGDRPLTDDEGRITKETFAENATQCLVTLLKKTLKKDKDLV